MAKIVLDSTPDIVIYKGEAISIPDNALSGDMYKINGNYVIYNGESWDDIPSKEYLDSKISEVIDGNLMEESDPIYTAEKQGIIDSINSVSDRVSSIESNSDSFVTLDTDQIISSIKSFNGIQVFNNGINNGGYVLDGVGEPVLDTQATNKKYVDDKIDNINIPNNYVTLDTAQNITAGKSFSNESYIHMLDHNNDESIIIDGQHIDIDNNSYIIVDKMDGEHSIYISANSGIVMEGLPITGLDNPTNDTDAVNKSYVDMANLTQDNTLSTHMSTDVTRWANANTAERRGIIQDAYVAGLMEDIPNTRNIDIGITEFDDEYGGVLDVNTTNTNWQYAVITFSNGDSYSTNGIAQNIELNKSFYVNHGISVTISGNVESTFTPFIEDVNNPITVLKRTLSDKIFELTQQILEINAARQNKHLGTVVVDIESASQVDGYIVPDNSGLGGQIIYEGIDALILSTGWVDINGTRVYDYGGLLGLKLGTLKESRDVMDGDLIKTGGLASITYTAYVEGQS